MDAEALNKIHEDLDFIKQKVIVMDNELEDISNDLHKVRPEYLEKLKKIKKGKFHSFSTKKEFLDFLENEI
jgi:hypothetical protein|tara:strand:- start:381 stop:593 length:213 start_codon:yes stop_codon:yes gene_type:complete